MDAALPANSLLSKLESDEPLRDYLEGAEMKTSDLNAAEQQVLQMIAGAMQQSTPEQHDAEFGEGGLEAFLRGILIRIQNARNAARMTLQNLDGPPR